MGRVSDQWWGKGVGRGSTSSAASPPPSNKAGVNGQAVAKKADITAGIECVGGRNWLGLRSKNDA